MSGEPGATGIGVAYKRDGQLPTPALSPISEHDERRTPFPTYYASDESLRTDNSLI